MTKSALGRKVLLLEFNEITWDIVDRLIQKGTMPNFARLRAEGTWTSSEAVERPPYLDPWITWVTLHTGVDRSVHGAAVLEQDESTIKAKRTWEYAAEAGKSVGVFGSVGAYPPRPVGGFMVPGPFAPSNATFPPYVEPVQALNRKYTQVHHKNAEQDSPATMLKLGLDLLRLGLTPQTCLKIAAQLAREKANPATHYKRVMLQPEINFDFFRVLYRRYRPDFATWHSNHAAHYMHHYWRAWDDSGFPSRASEDEKSKYGTAVEEGYALVDDLLGRFERLVDDDTVIAVASSMGQKPYVNDLYPDGKVCVKFKDIRAVLAIVGADGISDVVPTMDPQWNVKVVDAAQRARVRAGLEDVRCRGGVHERAMHVEETGDILTVTPLGLAKLDPSVRYFFPDNARAKAEGYLFDELFRGYAETNKEGMHDPKGIFALRGPGIARGLEIKGSTNLDVAPTLLALMGIAVPAQIMGRPLSEAWGEAPVVRSGRSVEARA